MLTQFQSFFHLALRHISNIHARWTQALENMNYSIEFCGGTHLTSLGEAEEIFLVKEEPVQSGTPQIRVERFGQILCS